MVATMSWAATIGTGIVTGLAGAVGAGVLTYFTCEWYGLRRNDGADLGYYIVFIPVGILCGFAIGAIISRMVPGYAAAQALSLGAVIAICALGGFVSRLYGEVPPELDGDKLILHVELKYPPDWEPDREAKRPEGRFCDIRPMGPGHRMGARSGGNVIWEDRRQENGQWVVPCDVRLTSSREVRYVSETLGKSWAQFYLHMDGRPSNKNKEWSPWISEGFSYRDSTGPVTGYSYRYKVERISAIRDREGAAANAFWNAREQALAALTDDAPMEQWIALFEDPNGTPAGSRWGGAERRERKVVSARVLELAPLLQSKDPKVMRQAVFALGALYETPQELVQPLVVAGQLVPELIREARATPVTDDDPGTSQEKAQTRALQYFSMWKNAMNNLKPAPDARFRPVLAEIVREAEATPMKGDVEILVREAKESLQKVAAPAR
jgi:hypothetical protein